MRLWWTLCLLLSLTSRLFAQELSTIPGLVAQWKASPDFIHGQKWYSTVRGYTGTFTSMTGGSTTSGFGTTARRNSSGEVRFDGTNDYIAVNGPPQIAFGSGSYTWSLWLLPKDLSLQWQGLFTFFATAGAVPSVTVYVGTTANASWGPFTNGFGIGLQKDASNTLFTHSTNNALTQGAWQHLTCVYDGTKTAASRFTLYVNGRNVTDTGDTALAGTMSDMGPFIAGYLGWDSYAGDPNFTGAMDDIRVYNRALTQTEILQSMFETPPIVLTVADVTIPLAPEFTAGGIPSTGMTVPNALVAQWKGLQDFSRGNFWYNLVAPQHGTLTNGAIFQASGRQGGVQHLFCDGVNDSVNITPPVLTGGKYTIMFWAKDDFSGTFGFNLDMTYTAGRFALSLNGGNWAGVARGISIFVNAPTYDLSAANALPLNTWSHIAVTLNAAANLSTGYINGKATGTGSYAETFGGTGTLFRFCTRDDLSGSYSKGLYDDLRLYDAELTAADIRTLYQQSIQDTGIMTASFLPTITAIQGKGFFNFFGQ